MSEDEESNYRPIKRIRQACRNCRRKKARCTGEKPICGFCRRLSQQCTYSDEGEPFNNATFTDGNNNATSASDSSEIETFNARLTAIESKLLQLVDITNSISTSLQTHLSNQTQVQQPLPAWERSGNNEAQLGNAISQPSPFAKPPPLEVQLNAADVYFRYCHNQPYSLFHEESFRQKLSASQVPHHLLYAFLASAVRYSTDPYYEDKIESIAAYTKQSWKAIVMPWNGIEDDAGITIVQTILLLAIIDYTDGKTQGAWIKVGLAIRISQDFRLMVEPDSSLSTIHQEERRRVFWSFYIADKLISCGRERPAAILDEHCKLQLPCDELMFRAGRAEKTPTLDQFTGDNPGKSLSSLNSFALTTVMASTLGRCAQYALGEQEKNGPGGQYSPWSPNSKFSALHSILLQLESDLALGDSLTDKIQVSFLNVDGSIDQQRAAPFIFAHALFYLCHCLLYHPFLLKQRLENTGTKAPSSFVAQTLDGCKNAAQALSKLMDAVRRLGCHELSTFCDPFYGYCDMVAGTIHSIFLHSLDHSIVEASRAFFDSSIRSLNELSYFWKSSKLMLARLENVRANSSCYAAILDPSTRISQFSEIDIAEIIECLDYSRLSTAPRHKSGGEEVQLISNLPSPFFDDFLNMLPLGYGRQDSSMTQMPPIPESSAVSAGFEGSLLESTPNGSLHIVNFPDEQVIAAVQRKSLSFSPEDGQQVRAYLDESAAQKSGKEPALGILEGRVATMGPHMEQYSAPRRMTSPAVLSSRPWYEVHLQSHQIGSGDNQSAILSDLDMMGTMPHFNPNL